MRQWRRREQFKRVCTPSARRQSHHGLSVTMRSGDRRMCRLIDCAEFCHGKYPIDEFGSRKRKPEPVEQVVGINPF